MYEHCRLHLLKCFEMKKFLMSGMIVFSLVASAQMKEGRVVYERTFQLPTRLFNADPAMASQLPKSRTDQYELLFGNNQSLWQFLPNANNEGDPGTFASGGMVIRMAGGGSNSTSFHDFAKGLPC